MENLEVAPPPLDSLPQLEEEEAVIDLAAVRTKRWNILLQLVDEDKPKDLIVYADTEEQAEARVFEAYKDVMTFSMTMKEAGYISVGGQMILPADEKFELIDRQYDFTAKKKS